MNHFRVCLSDATVFHGKIKVRLGLQIANPSLPGFELGAPARKIYFVITARKKDADR